MAESVDALVSNTSGATRAGSTPALGTTLVSLLLTSVFLFYSHSHTTFITANNILYKKDEGNQRLTNIFFVSLQRVCYVFTYTMNNNS